METLEQIKARAEKAVPGARLEIVPNGSPSAQPSLLVDNDHTLGVAKLLREESLLRFDYASNVTAGYLLDTVVKGKTKVKQHVYRVEKEEHQPVSTKKTQYLEHGYHFYSIVLKQR